MRRSKPRAGELTGKEVAERIGVAYSTLTLWRKKGKGPKWIERGPYFFYDEDSVEEFEANSERIVDPEKESPQLVPEGDQSPASMENADEQQQVSQ